MRFLSLVIFLLPLTAHAVDPNEFPETSLQSFETKLPEGSGPRFVARAPGLSLKGRVTGGVRALPSATRDFLLVYNQQFGKLLKEPLDFSLFAQEVALWDETSKQIIWLPVPNRLLEPLRREPGPSDRVRLFLRYLGKTIGGPVYVLVDFQLLPSETTKEKATLPIHSWKSLCGTISCEYHGATLLNPPYEFRMAGKFSGKSRLVLPRFLRALEAYEKNFSLALFASAAEIANRYSHEAEFSVAGEKKTIWIPLTQKDLQLAKKWRRKKVTVLVSVYGNTEGEMTFLGNEVAQPD